VLIVGLDTFVYPTNGHKGNQKKPRRDKCFSHIGNLVWLHWGTSEYCNIKRIVHWAKWCAPTVPVKPHSLSQMAAAAYMTVILDHHGKPSECRNYTTPHPPTPFQNGWEYFSWMSLNCKQCSYISYDYTRHKPHSGVTWGRGVSCGMSDSVVFPAALWAYLWGFSRGQSLKWANLALADNGDIKRQSVFDTAVSNGGENVRKICSGALLKNMGIQPTSLRCSWAQMKSLNHEYSGGEALFTADNLAFMETLLAVSALELTF